MLYNTTFHWFIYVLKNRKNLTSFLSQKKPCRFDVYTAIKMLIIHTGNTKLWRANWSKTKRINTRTIVSLLLLSLKITRFETDCHGNEIGDRYEVRFQTVNRCLFVWQWNGEGLSYLRPGGQCNSCFLSLFRWFLYKRVIKRRNQCNERLLRSHFSFNCWRL